MAIPSEAHMAAFGRVIHHFAFVETGIKIAISGILECDLGAVLIFSEPYSSLDLKNVAKSLAKERLKPEHCEKFVQIVGDWSKFASLRNVIAHSRWTDGDRPGTIKPRSVKIRQGRADWIGDDPSETSYSAADLEDVVTDLRKVDQRLRDFLTSSGLQAIIEAKTDASSADTSLVSGTGGM